MLQFSSVASVNCLYWITSLEPDKQGTTRRVIEDLHPFFARVGLPFEVFEAHTAAELVTKLQEIAVAANFGAKPIIHLDTHGLDDKEVFIAETKEFVSWSKIYTLFRAINIKTENNLCVVSAACYSLELVKQISITEACPFFILLAPEKTVSFGFIEQATLAFYEDVFRNLNILEAYEKHLKPGLSVFHTERMFAIVFARYFKFKCMGRGGRERREDLLTQAVTLGIANNRRNRRVIRSTTKTMTRPTPEVVNRFAHTFLIGKRIPFGFGELLKLIKGAEPTD